MILCFSGCSEDEEIVISNGTVAEDASNEDPSGPSSEETEEAEETGKAESCFVYLTGAVKKPGVYEVPAGTRVFKVIDFSGGLREDAAAEALNLAAAVTDGAVIRVPDRKEYEEAENKQTSFSGSGTEGLMSGAPGEAGGKGLININTASVSELMGLNGIGESRAQAIISYREENGAFKNIEEIKNVSGIKDGLFNKIRDQITV